MGDKSESSTDPPNQGDVQPSKPRGDTSIQEACSEAVKKIYSLGFTLDTFLDALCYGDESCRDVTELKTARKHLRDSALLPGILDRLHTTPRTKSKGKQAPGAVEPLESWALALAEGIYRRELLDFASQMKCDMDEIVNEETLSELTFQSILEEVMQHAPRLFKLLSSLCEGKRRAGQERTGKDPTFCVVNLISALSYQVSQLNNRTQMFFAIYLKAKGAPKSIFTLLQQCGLSLSYNWAQNAVKSISKEAMEKAIAAFEEHPCFFLYDNLRFPFDVKHQTSDNISVTDNGTAITVIPIEDEAAHILNDPDSFLEHRQSVKQKYIDDSMEFLSPSDLHRPTDEATINRRLKHNILAALLRIPALKHVEALSDPLLRPPEPIEALPHGPDHHSKQFMLGTVDIEEASLAGNHAVMRETLRQLRITTPAQQRDLAQSRMQVWLGDQLTVSRGKGLTEVKQPELNSFERNDWTHWEPGWFHILMNLAKSIYYTDFGSSTGLLLARDVATLGRAGLKTPTKQKGPEFHTLDEALHHILEARYRGLWIWALGATDMEDLVTKVECTSPKQLVDAANKIWLERASSRALTHLDHAKVEDITKVDGKTVRSVTNVDPVLESIIRSTRNLMLFEETRRAVRFGDVGQMELLLPRLLFHFSGTGSGNYTRMLTNMLQWRKYEAPPGFARVMRRNIWLVNFNGEPDGFYPSDLRQELNNLAIRLHGPPPQSRTWEQYYEISPAIPVFSKVIDQFDRQFSNFYRSRIHYVPDPENDISNLVEKHIAAKIHVFDPKRESNPSNVNVDPIQLGQQKVLYSSYLADYATQRKKYYQHSSTMEVYTDQEYNLTDLVAQIAGVRISDVDRGNQPPAPDELSGDHVEHSVQADSLAHHTPQPAPFDPTPSPDDQGLYESHQPHEGHPDPDNSEFDEIINKLHYLSMGLV